MKKSLSIVLIPSSNSIWLEGEKIANQSLTIVLMPAVSCRVNWWRSALNNKWSTQIWLYFSLRVTLPRPINQQFNTTTFTLQRNAVNADSCIPENFQTGKPPAQLKFCLFSAALVGRHKTLIETSPIMPLWRCLVFVNHIAINRRMHHKESEQAVWISRNRRYNKNEMQKWWRLASASLIFS